MRLVATMLGIAAIAFLFNGANALGQEITIDDLLQMWSQRQLAAKTAEFHWVEKVAADGNASPGSKSVAYDCTLRLGIDSSIRSDRILSAKQLESDESLTRPGLAVSSFDGNRNRYFTSAIASGDHHRGIEFDAEHYDEIVNYHLRAILLAYRPLLILPSAYSSRDSRIVRHDAKLEIADQTVLLDGVPCLLIETHTDDALVRNRYWIDTARKGLILKHIESVGDRQTTEMTIKYQNDPTDGWFPLIWHAKFLNTTIKGLVIDHAINKELGPGIFKIEYPNGTIVFDQDLSMQERVQADGSRSRVTPTGKNE